MLFDDSYYTIEGPSEGLYKEKGSKFLAFAYPAASEEEIKEYLAVLRREHHGARHHCYAWRLKPDKSAFRANDDGEPSNTGGKPILGQIQSKDLTNVLVVVVRYFGGTLLGVGGLINAYKTAAREALNHAGIVSRRIQEVYDIAFGYELLSPVMKALKDNQASIQEQDLSQPCRIRFAVYKSDADSLLQELKQGSILELTYIKTI